MSAKADAPRPVERIAVGFKVILAIAISAQAVYSAWFGTFDLNFGRTLLLAAAIAVVLVSHTLLGIEFERVKGKPLRSRWLLAIDALLIVLFALVTWHLIRLLQIIDEEIYTFTDFDIAMAFGGIAVILEATRRRFGWPIVLVSIAAMVFVSAGPYLPGMLHHSGFDWTRAMQIIWFSFQGVYGTPLGVVIQVVLVFIVFGVTLEKVGASDALIRLSLAASGGTRGGPAHAAVIASALFGSMSGSVTANVVGTGSFTIPMIKRRGFPAAVAGAIEAAASTGGQIVPPVMGAAAFLMADLLQVSSRVIVVAAIVPSLLYYLALFIAITIEARRAGIEPTPAAERVRLTRVDAWSSLGFILPIVVIASVLIAGYSATMSGLLATVTAALLGLFRAEVRKHLWRTYVGALADAGVACASILVVVGCIGVVIGVMNLTGLGISFASTVASFTSDSLFAALLVTAIACLILGMGMPTLPAYLIIILVLGPALGKLGVEPILAHMFVFYFGVLSAITPPVAIGAFAAAPIAQADPMQTGFQAVRMAFVGFIIPFAFVYEPQLILGGQAFDAYAFFIALVSLVIAIWYLHSSVAGHGWFRLGWSERAVQFLIGAALLVQWPAWQAVAIVAGLAKLALDWRRSRRL